MSRARATVLIRKYKGEVGQRLSRKWALLMFTQIIELILSGFFIVPITQKILFVISAEEFQLRGTHFAALAFSELSEYLMGALQSACK